MLVYPPPLNIKSAQPLEINYLILWGSTIMYQEYLLFRGCGGFRTYGKGIICILLRAFLGPLVGRVRIYGPLHTRLHLLPCHVQEL